MAKRILIPNGREMFRINLKYGGIGILIGLIINAFVYITGSGLQLRYFIYNISFAFFITLSVSNIVALFQYNFFAFQSRFWKYVAGYYICNLVGMAIGTELSYMVVSLVFNLKMNIALHFSDYKFNSLLVLLIGTIMLLMHMQKMNSSAVIAAKENDLAKAKQLNMAIELQALQSKINPHFLYNALNSIVSLIHEDPYKAEDMTMKLSKLFRYSINSMQENLHPLLEELEILKTYLDIEKVRFGNRMNFDIVVGDELGAIPVPRFLIQPLVENSIKHGLKNKVSDAQIKVDISIKDGQLAISVGDNGLPFPDNMQIGYGLQSTYDKLKLLYGENYQLQFINEPKQILILIPANL
ncbi:MAG: histidine kinase [Bacteroidota bacterium]